MTHSGGCQCGAIRYRAEKLGDFVICHCRMCQKAFGNFGAALADAQGLTFTRGKPSEFRSSSIVSRGFCSQCGTPLYMREDGYPHEIAVGTLDHPDEAGHPKRQSGGESRLRWFATMVILPEETTNEYRSPDDLKKLKSRQHPDHDTDEWPAGGAS